jgi:hypothetical protein
MAGIPTKSVYSPGFKATKGRELTPEQGGAGSLGTSGTSKYQKKSGDRIGPVLFFTGRSGTSSHRMYRIIRSLDFPGTCFTDSGNFGYRIVPVGESTRIEFLFCVENWQADANI